MDFVLRRPGHAGRGRRRPARHFAGRSPNGCARWSRTGRRPRRRPVGGDGRAGLAGDRGARGARRGRVGVDRGDGPARAGRPRSSPPAPILPQRLAGRGARRHRVGRTARRRRDDRTRRGTQVAVDGRGRLSGRPEPVIHGASASVLVVPAVDTGGDHGLYAVDLGAAAPVARAGDGPDPAAGVDRPRRCRRRAHRRGRRGRGLFGPRHRDRPLRRDASARPSGR